MKEARSTSLYFTKEEVLEALELWCQHHHTAYTAHFRNEASIDWVLNTQTDQMDLAVMFDGVVESDLP